MTSEKTEPRVARIAFGLACYAAFLATAAYAVGFVGNYWSVFGWQGPWFRSLDQGPRAAVGEAALVDLALVALFGVQHSVMARRGFKRWWARFVPTELERSAFVLASSLCFALLFWQWRPIGVVLWDVSRGMLGYLLVAGSLVGWFIAVRSTFLIHHAELFGLRQVFGGARSESAVTFETPGLYRTVRHPLYLGFLVAFWSSPVMTLGHLLFAAGLTVYVLVAIPLEERDLTEQFGDRYRDYRKRVRALLPFRRSD
jgi:protein-S-isoprenylcysteine O-methyltransferase Ste14